MSSKDDPVADTPYPASPRRRRGGPLLLAFAVGGCSLLPSPGEIEIPENDPSFRTRVYAGAAIGNAHLTPDTSGSAFDVDGTDDVGTQMRLGVDVHNMLAAEVDTSVLGAARLEQGGADVNYSAATVSALVYGLSGVQMRSRREGWSAYGRVGLGILKKSSVVDRLEESGTVPVLGIGAEYGFDNGLGIRGEITRFDEDAVYASLGAVYRFGLTPRDLGGMIADAVEPALGAEETRVAAGGRTLSPPGRFGRDERRSEEPALGAARAASTRPTRWRPPTLADDGDRDGVRDAHDLCPDTLPDVTVDNGGCGLFDAVLSDVVFKSGSHFLTARARGQLDELAERLLAFPEARVRVLAHTDATGSADDNLALSARRAEAVVQYLHARGVGELQLEGRGLGETRPLASNADPDGRRRNRRVELVTLANLDEEMAIRFPAITDDQREEPRWLPPLASIAAAASATAPAPIAAPIAAPSVAPVAPPLAAARPAPAAVPSVAPVAPPLAAARRAAPTPLVALPSPGRVPGLEIGGVLENVTFVSGSDDLVAEAEPTLARVAAELRRHPEARVAIMAHTDDLGSEANNLALSGRRAERVLDHLVDLGIERSRLVAEGYGETLPLVQNVTAADRARNRRVELRVLP